MKLDLRLLLKGGSRFLFIASCFAALAWSGFLIANAWLISDLIIRSIEMRSVSQELNYLLALWIFRAFFLSGFESWTAKRAINEKLSLRARATANASGLRTLAPATVSTLLTKGLNSIDIFYGRFIPQFIFSIIIPLILIAVVATRDILSAIAAIVTLPLIPFFGALIGRYTSDAVGRKWRTLGTLSSYFEDSLRGFATLKIFGRTPGQSKRIKEMGERYSDETMKVLRISFLSSLVLELMATISVAVIAVEIGLRLVGGHIKFSNALMILILAPEIYFPLRNAAALFHASTDGNEALRKLDAIPRFEQDVSSNQNYPTGLQFWVGPSGVGKSTAAMELMHRLEKRAIAWVPQHPRLAQGTVRRQFQLVDPQITDEQIASLLSRFNLELNDLPNGLDSQLETGSELLSTASGGQIRKIALARALAKNPRLLIADEPTADLDSTSAKRVMQTLRGLKLGVIVITHDLELINESDDVVRIEK